MAPIPRHYSIAYRNELTPWPGVELTDKEAAFRLAEDLSYCAGYPIVVMCGRIPIKEFAPRDDE